MKRIYAPVISGTYSDVASANKGRWLAEKIKLVGFDVGNAVINLVYVLQGLIIQDIPQNDYLNLTSLNIEKVIYLFPTLVNIENIRCPETNNFFRPQVNRL